jgi:hypothetical protein
MLGYDVEDVSIMLDMVEQAILYIPPSQEAITIGLKMAASFLEGAIAEGHVY